MSPVTSQNCREAEEIGSRKLETVRERLVQLMRVEQALATLLELCHGNRGKVRCPLIAALESE
jgi:MerR family transcriptional regulator, mercuric resistance operon regulatory protein